MLQQALEAAAAGRPVAVEPVLAHLEAAGAFGDAAWVLFLGLPALERDWPRAATYLARGLAAGDGSAEALLGVVLALGFPVRRHVALEVDRQGFRAAASIPDVDAFAAAWCRAVP